MLKLVTSIALALGLLASSGVAMADRGRDHRGRDHRRVEVRDRYDGRGHHGDHRRPVISVNVYRPHRAPPVVRYERVTPRRGYVWVSGRYDWRDNDYAWTAGRWEQEQPNRQWIDGRWVIGADGYYAWVDGTWQDVAPAVVVDARPAHQSGYVWIAGHHARRHGQHVWVAGHWQLRNGIYR